MTSVIAHQSEIRCLASNIYFEAVGEGKEGWKAVGFVTMNRVKHPKYPNSVCKVVKQRNKRGCQFSWYCMKKFNQRYYKLSHTRTKEYKKIDKIARNIYNNKVKDVTKGSIFYHSKKVEPSWRESFNQTITIGNHIFYK